MSAQEIIAELSKLKADDLRLVKEKLAQLEAVGQQQTPRSGWGEALSEIVATADDLPATNGASDPFLVAVTQTAKSRPHWPADYALNHGHYVSGEPKK